MSFKKILGAFIEIPEDEKAPVKKTGTEVKKSTITDIAPETMPPTPQYTSTNTASASEFEGHFNNLIEEENKKNFPGTDFYEFIIAKENMNAIPVEETKYVTTFNVLKSTGLTKQVLLDTAKRYKDIVVNELNAFLNTFQQTYKQQVDDKQALIDQKAKQMQQLSEQINVLNQEMLSIQTEMNQNKIKLSSKKEGFQIAALNKQKSIQDEIDKIEKYVQG